MANAERGKTPGCLASFCDIKDQSCMVDLLCVKLLNGRPRVAWLGVRDWRLGADSFHLGEQSPALSQVLRLGQPAAQSVQFFPALAPLLFLFNPGGRQV